MITKEKHEKHPFLSRPDIGSYHRNEWAIYGSNCGNIKALFAKINESLCLKYKLAYVDADHGTPSMVTDYQIGKKHFFIDASREWNEYDDKTALPQCDAVIVNGNHYPARNQIVIIDPSKKDSLLKRVPQLTNITLIIKTSPDTEVYDFLLPKIGPHTLTVNIEDADSIAKAIGSAIEKAQPKLKALVLAGGKSKRMGKDKSLIQYHEKPQQVHLADICHSLNLETYISKGINCNEIQIDRYPVIKDRMVDMGPFGAIISAMMFDPDSAWLVLACDLPFVDGSFLTRLISERDTSLLATAIKSKSKDFPEPLVSIYEPNMYPRFLKFMSLGYSCPRKVLINSEIKVIDLEKDQIIDNVNTLEESKAAIFSIKQKS